MGNYEKEQEDSRQLNKNSSAGNTIRTAILVFTVTLIIILGVGIPSMILISNRSKNPIVNNENVAKTKWETIPITEIQSDNSASEENPEAEETPQPIVIPEEDEGYTHIFSPAVDDAITIGFAGDILFDDHYAVGNAFRNHGNSAVGVVGTSLLEKMNNVDIMMVNNEFPYSNGGSPTEGKTYTFRARPETASILNEMGVDIVGLANNHAYDYGETALLDTFNTLESVGIEYAGAGRNIDEASHTIYYITESGRKFAIICATQIERLSNPDTKEATATSAGVFRCLDDTRLLERITEAKEKDAFVIVFIHWGTESTQELDYLQRDQAAEIAAAGADLIIGAHPHILQKIDYIGDVPVVYSLGNYIFNSKNIDTCMIIATIHGDNAIDLQMVPALQRNCTVKEADDYEAGRIWNDMMAMSPNITIDENGYIRKK